MEFIRGAARQNARRTGHLERNAMKVTFAAAASGDAIAAPVYADRKLSDAAKGLDSASGGAISRALEASRFKGGAGEVLELTAPAGVNAVRVVLYGLGEAEKVTGNVAEKAAAAVIKALLTGGAKTVSFHVDGDAEAACRMGLGAALGAYRFDAYRTKLADEKKPSVEAVELVVSDVADAESRMAGLGPGGGRRDAGARSGE
jgi:leucyl aminopeptidase